MRYREFLCIRGKYRGRQNAMRMHYVTRICCIRREKIYLDLERVEFGISENTRIKTRDIESTLRNLQDISVVKGS